MFTQSIIKLSYNKFNSNNYLWFTLPHSAIENDQAALTIQQNIVRTRLEMVQDDLKTKATESWTNNMITAAEISRVTSNFSYSVSLKFIYYFIICYYIYQPAETDDRSCKQSNWKY